MTHTHTHTARANSRTPYVNVRVNEKGGGGGGGGGDFRQTLGKAADVGVVDVGVVGGVGDVGWFIAVYGQHAFFRRKKKVAGGGNCRRNVRHISGNMKLQLWYVC